MRVTVIDQGQVGAGCSYGNAGLIALSHIKPLPAPGVLVQGIKWMLDSESPFYIRPRWDPALYSWLWKFRAACREAPMRKGMDLTRALTQASMALFQKLAALDTLDFHFHQKGSLRICKDSRSLETSVRESDDLEQYDVRFKVLDSAAVRELEPMVQPGIAGGIYYPDDAHLNPSEFVRGLASHAERRGVRFLTSTEALGFETAGHGISAVKTTRGDFKSEHVVLAAGSWSTKLAAQLRLTLPIQPAKGYSITVKCPTADHSLPLWLGDSRVVVTPMGGVLRFAGTLELSGMDFSITPGRVRAIKRATQEYLRDTDKYELSEIWRGLRPLTPDGLPIVGRSKEWTNLILATGHGSQGIALAPVTGELVSQILYDETPSVDMAGLRPERFE